MSGFVFTGWKANRLKLKRKFFIDKINQLLLQHWKSGCLGVLRDRPGELVLTF
jgi:hypothetical protein